ncbi:hypothetical protein Pmani_019384 [Petrolisthes manimaculis]|uniref:Uncharacterized protein n=1 Tax=Petrolisthes manimaculis TaxID=1843537 RepID=A0AAE1PKJ3_9EUCA|nr:hypothetical protein Pmani_019384 [Petrolisthes manimaculis]
MALVIGPMVTGVAAGAIGMAIYGLAVYRRRRALTRRSRNRNARRYNRRYYRSTSEDTPALERVMEGIRKQDVSGCGLRLVCELASRTHQDLAMEEWAILDLVGNGVKGGDGDGDGALQQYKTARGVGEKGGNCGTSFPYCPLTGTQLMHSIMAYLP